MVVSLRSSSCLTPDPVDAGPFPSALTTMALNHSRRRWFEVRSCKPTSRGRPSSVKQLRILLSCEIRVLMAHDDRQTGSYGEPLAKWPRNFRFADNPGITLSMSELPRSRLLRFEPAKDRSARATLRSLRSFRLKALL